MSVKISNMSDVWVDRAAEYTAIQMNAFDVNSSVGSKLFDLKRNGVSQFTVNKLGELVVGTLDIPRVNSLEEAITALSAAGLAKVDHIAANVAILQANLSFANGSLAMVYSDPNIVNNDWYYKVGDSGSGSWANTGLIPELASTLTPKKGVSRTIYVTMDGNDDNDGRSLYKPVQRINRALEIANTIVNTDGEGPCVVIVHPGEYEVEPYTQIPPNVTLYGYDVRATKLRIATGYANTNMFLLNSGCKVRGFTFTGLRHEDSWNPTDFDAGPPKYGYAFAFAPGAYITRSPYLSDCSVLHQFSYQEMSLPQDRDAGNPLMPRGMGNLYADGSVCDPDSPLRSVVVDSFTAVNPNGVGYSVVKDAIVQLVSVFTNWSRVGLWAHSGGQLTVVNSNITFGDYSFISTGFRYSVRAPGVANPAGLSPAPVIGNFIKNNIDTITDVLMNVDYPTITDWDDITNNATYVEFTERDTKTILKETADDLIAGQDKGLKFWVQGLFKTIPSMTEAFSANTTYVFDSAILPQFLGSFGKIRDRLINYVTTVSGAELQAVDMIDQYFTMAINVVGNPIPYTTVFQSKIESASHQFSYAGSGVNYNALPFGQRSSGLATDPLQTLYKSKGGVIYATFNTEQGDTYLGEDLRVDFERSTIEGQAFSRGVQNITLPLIIGIGG